MTRPSISVTELAEKFRSGDDASLRSIANYLDSLEAHFNAREPEVLSFVPEAGRFDRLRREAEAIVDRWPNPAGRPPLFGVPVGVKDIFHAAGFTTRAGSRLPAESLQGPEAECVTALKNAGALVMGKTVTTEFAYFGPGPTRNPHHAAHTPGGSSSGSAAAVGAGLCPLTLGTQTIGSVIRPASFCGVVGFKPTYGRISRAGVIPLSPSFDHVGLFAADAGGAARAAGVLVKNWTPRVEGSDRKRPVLGVPEGPYLERASAEMLTHFQATCRKLAGAGYAIKRVTVMPDFDATRERHYTITAAEAAYVHRDWFPRYRELYHPKTVELLERGQSIPAETVAEALQQCLDFRAEVARVMETEGIDAWVSPSAVGPAPQGLESTGDPVMNLPWTQAGFPALNLPSGQNAAGLPLGLQLTARPNADERLFDWAAELETILAG